MSTSLVYLAGPITGTKLADCSSWREVAAKELASHGIDTLNPLRFKPWLEKLADRPIPQSNEEDPLSMGKAITRRDYFDVCRSNIVLAYVLGADKVSIGTVMELAWAYERRIPVVLVMEEGNPHDHAMIKECCAFRACTLEAGIELVVRIL